MRTIGSSRPQETSAVYTTSSKISLYNAAAALVSPRVLLVSRLGDVYARANVVLPSSCFVVFSHDLSYCCLLRPTSLCSVVAPPIMHLSLRSVLRIPFSAFLHLCSAFLVQCSAFRVPRSKFCLHHYVFRIPRYALIVPCTSFHVYAFHVLRSAFRAPCPVLRESELSIPSCYLVSRAKFSNILILLPA